MNLLFDYDGTLHDSSATYLPAFRKTLAWLEEHGYDVDREYSDEQIGYWLGFSAKDMWNSFAPELDDAVKETCSKMIGAEMRRLTVDWLTFSSAAVRVRLPPRATLRKYFRSLQSTRPLSDRRPPSASRWR